jgi:mannose-1-phosphate guanylyltransferase
VRDIVVACSQGMREVEAHFGDGKGLDLTLRYSYEDRPLGSGRAVKQAFAMAGGSGTLVVCNGDILTNVDLTAMIARHRTTGATLSMSLAPVDDPWAYGVVEVDDETEIKSFVEKPPRGEEPSNLINAGTWLWEPEMLDRIPDDETAVRDGFSERVLFPQIIAAGQRVQGFLEDLWVDVGSPERYLRAHRLLLEREAPAGGVIGGECAEIDETVEVQGAVAVGAGTRVKHLAMLTGPCAVGAGVLIEDGAHVEASVLWDNVRIGERARVTGSILGGGVTVGAGAVVEDAVIADGAMVAPRTRLAPGTALEPGQRA